MSDPAHLSPKGAQRRAELVSHALACLIDKGYAATSLRDIASAAALNLGRLHYYFESKSDLLLEALRQYKSDYIQAVEATVGAGLSQSEIRSGFIRVNTLAATRDARIHRLWYDLKGRSLFEPALRPLVEEIEAALQLTLGRVLVALGAQDEFARPDELYFILDGLFQATLARSLAGDATAEAWMTQRYDQALPKAWRSGDAS